jgi:predicted dinucleotide-binding enzyme
VFIASDDETAKAKVSDLVKAAEFEPVDSGRLYNSRLADGRDEYFAGLLSGLGHL